MVCVNQETTENVAWTETGLIILRGIALLPETAKYIKLS